jgi:hypothetical protein
MKTKYTLLPLLLVLASTVTALSQEIKPDFNRESEPEYEEVKPEYHINTIFNNNGSRASGGYVAVTNKFTSINGNFANMVELYGGWYIGHRFLLGIGGASTTNYIPVALEHRMNPNLRMSYEYVQAGMMTEYVISSDRAIHVAFQLFGGGGLTVQYERPNLEDDDFWNDMEVYDHDTNIFAVAEPGVKVEVNIFRWLRFCPGVSYRLVYGSSARGITNASLENTSLNMSLKIGKF